MTTSVTVEEAGPGQFAGIIKAGRHVLSADEPFSAGGTDTGPGPYEYLVAALGACTTMTLRMYVKRKGWAAGRISCVVTHDHVHAEDCVDWEKKDVTLDRITRTIRIEADLDDERRQRLLDIANKCPVHRTLTSKISVETTLD
jgi:putative redox protein